MKDIFIFVRKRKLYSYIYIHLHPIFGHVLGRVWVKLPIFDPYPIYPNNFDIPDPNLTRNTRKNRVTRPEPDPENPEISGYLIHTRYQKMPNLKKKYFFKSILINLDNFFLISN